MKSEAGKGDANRIRGKKAREQYERNYIRIFGKKKIKRKDKDEQKRKNKRDT